MNNPLFGTTTFSPFPAGQNAVNNPVWSDVMADDEDRAAPNTAPGMRRLGALQPWELPVGEDRYAHPILSTAAAQIPAPAAAAAALGRDRPEEAAFSDALGRLMRGEADAAGTIAAYADICNARAAELRDLAISQLQKAARYMALSEAAAELEAEAATWQLLWFLHGVPGRDFPAGRGGDFVEGAGLAKTFHQLAADLVFQDDVLNRAARAVAWLEASAAAADPEPEQGLVRSDGVWQETRGKLAAGAAARAFGGVQAALVTELDPDATTRERARLDADNIKDEERLMKMVWRLVRGGRAARAAAACRRAGQPWRAASLGGGGFHGPLPLGAAAEECDSASSGEPQAEALAGEAEHGPAALRALWRWTCFQAAERIAGGVEATGGGAFESAVYAALSSHVTRALPACASWEDALWAYLRCWLDAAVDSEVAAAAPQLHANNAAAGGVSSSLESEGLAAAAGASWPTPQVRDALPVAFADAVEAGGAQHGGAPPTADGAQRFRRVQLDLILDRIDPLVSQALVRWIIGDAAQHAAPSSAGSASAMHDAPPPPGLMRFAAHLALMLWTLGVAAVPRTPDPSAAYSQLHDLLQRLVQVYSVHLIDTGASSLVPAYACHLRAGLRRATYLIFLEQLLARGDAEACRAAYTAGGEIFAAWGGGDVEPDEMPIIARKAVSKAQMESGGGPLARARSLLWLCLDETTRADAVHWACTLCREFSLGGAGGAAAAAALLGDVIPAAVPGESPLDRLLSDAERAGAGAEAAELRVWARFFELEIEFSSWESVYEAAVGDAAAAADEGDAQAAMAQLAADTMPLLQAAVDFLREGRSGGWLVSAPTANNFSTDGGPAAGEIAVVVGPGEAGDEETEALVAAGEAYPAFATLEDQSAAAAALQAALAAAAGGFGCPPGSTAFHAGMAPVEGSVHLPGLVSVAVDSPEPAGLQAAALLSAALKGDLADGSGSTASVSNSAFMGPLICANVSASPDVVAALCRAAVVPRIALKAAALRHAVVRMGGEVGAVGADVMAMCTADDGSGTAALFSSDEMAGLVELDAAATAALLRRGRRE